MKRTYASLLLPLVTLAWGPTLAIASILQASAHEGHEHFTAGEPGDPTKLSRIVKVTMLEEGKQMLFEQAVVEVRLGEQIRFVIYNEGTWNHELILATNADNRKHAELMKRFPDMAHDDPNAKRLSPFSSTEILWKFTKRGEFEYACLIPGHLEFPRLEQRMLVTSEVAFDDRCCRKRARDYWRAMLGVALTTR